MPKKSQINEYSDKYNFPNCVTIEFEVADKSWRCNPIFFKHVFLWCLLFDFHLTTHQSIMSVQPYNARIPYIEIYVI